MKSKEQDDPFLTGMSQRLRQTIIYGGPDDDRIPREYSGFTTLNWSADMKPIPMMEWRPISEIGELSIGPTDYLDLLARRWLVSADIFEERRFVDCLRTPGALKAPYGNPENWEGLDPEWHATHFLVIQKPNA
jgi:hypothetical protein